MKILFLLLLGICQFLFSKTDSLRVLSPDKQIVCTLFIPEKGQLFYTITFNKKLVLNKSRLGITIDNIEFGNNAKIVSEKHSAKDETYTVRGVHTLARDHYNQVLLNLQNSINSMKFQLDIRVYDDGVAYRYVIPGSGTRKVNREDSQWNLPEGCTLWYNTDYERYYQHSTLQNLKDSSAVMPITIELPDKTGFMTITEGNLVDYGGSRIKFTDKGVMQLVLFGNPVISDTIETPWRLTIISKDLNGLVNSDMVTNVCPPPIPELQNAGWIKPGRAVWSWWASETVNPEAQKRYADMASELGFEYNLIDGGWEKWPDAWNALEDVVRYSKQKNVAVWVWKHSKELTDKTARIEFFKRVKAIGVVGVKIDFFPPETMETINYYNDILKDAAELGLMINFHGTNKPTGRNRTWPNEMTREGLCGQEWHITRYNRTEPLAQGTILPFTRFLVGPGDYTPCALNPKELRGFTWPHEFAEAVIFTSPLQHFADDPKFYLESPGKELIKTMPSVWDETIVLPGSKIGEVAAFARRKGDMWYVAAVNGEKERDFSVKLSFLDKNRWNAVAFSDNMNREDDMIRHDKFVGENDTLNFKMKPGGGYIARLMKSDVTGKKIVKESVSNDQKRTNWFTDARFGMFIHWGAYAIPAKGEWIMHSGRIPFHDYEEIARAFKPSDFNAAEIVRKAKDAGMKYLVITAKHHDGFCMWNTKLTDYNIVKWGGFDRDPIKELAAECQKQGIKLGFYYSVRDWHHPDFVLHYEHLNAPGPHYGGWYAFPVNWTGGEVMDCGCSACVKNIPLTKEQDPRPTEAEGADMNRYLDYMKGQIKELLTNYGPIAVMWFDGQDIVDQKKGRVQEMIDEMRQLQPDVLINDRIAWQPGMGDYGVFEQHIPGETVGVRPWETCMTLNDNWGYTPNQNWKTTKQIVHHLADIVSKGGNLLLNVALDGHGILSNDYQCRLDSIGSWLKDNGESIYGCGASDLPQPEWGRITAKENKLYLHVFNWPMDSRLLVEHFTKNVKKAYLLNQKSKIDSKLSSKGLELLLPGKMHNPIDEVIVLEF